MAKRASRAELVAQLRATKPLHVQCKQAAEARDRVAKRYREFFEERAAVEALLAVKKLITVLVGILLAVLKLITVLVVILLAVMKLAPVLVMQLAVLDNVRL